MSICQLGMHKSVQDHTNANVCKQTYDASCTHERFGTYVMIDHIANSASYRFCKLPGIASSS